MVIRRIAGDVRDDAADSAVGALVGMAGCAGSTGWPQGARPAHSTGGGHGHGRGDAAGAGGVGTAGRGATGLPAGHRGAAGLRHTGRPPDPVTRLEVCRTGAGGPDRDVSGPCDGQQCAGGGTLRPAGVAVCPADTVPDRRFYQRH